ncbi:prephenate dehydrogenase/arogenate dehydrogenase family protein [Thiomicrorhabdus sp. ZW0627]|uniref:prephenate dehydrogenase n=1 Tax=Thiomicrorhabdus sp. ZW0627 TaxID=3039774 RepID=UPI002436A1DC|nr:prephenate dehydrogenase/arogenate dehydrogenase family protein [Thiomicrorhabdus sp. ZW0627]MDG6772904.1 prephenate dehydrogenase/arogenate dehydrogenase family protein [Thiomicrorhabdus sp. ZW0627]
MKLKKITVVGVGLIGGSFAKGIKEAGLVEEVSGFGHNESNLKKAVELGVLDTYSTDIAEAVKESDLVMLGVPLGAMSSVLESMKPHLKSSVILSDVGSSKMSVIEAVKEVFGELPPNFVAGHPIAGKEKSGVEAATSDLFVDHRVILTPTAETSIEALQVVENLWKALGANVVSMDPGYHDEVLAATSHLPHLLAFSLVELLNEHPELGNVFQYTAGGFRDFTRIASSDPVMWRDIAVNNSEAIAKWLRHYQQSLTELITMVEQKDSDSLYHLFNEAKQARDLHIVNKD